MRLPFVLQQHSDDIHPKLECFGDTVHCLLENNHIDCRYFSIKMIQLATICWVSEVLASLINFKEVLENRVNLVDECAFRIKFLLAFQIGLDRLPIIRQDVG